MRPALKRAGILRGGGTYHFNVGGEMYTGRLLTDFSVGKVNTSTEPLEPPITKRVGRRGRPSDLGIN